MQQKVSFSNASGETLSGVLHQPDTGQARAHALFAHCFTCTKNVRAAVNIASALAGEGIAVLRFDFTGLGQSEGDFAHTDFSSNVQDLVDAANYLASEHKAPEILVGHSLGGTAVLAAAHQVDSAVAVATIGSPADAEHVLHLLDDDLEEIEKTGAAQVNLAGRPFRIRKDFVDNVRSQSVRDGIRSLRKALLVMHSPVDEQVSIDEAGRIYASALHPKSFVTLDDADHLLSREADSRYAGRVLSAWADRYIAARATLEQQARFEAGAVVVEGAASDGFRVSINAAGHVLVGDEPLASGGSAMGPSPYDFLAAALGTCSVMTLNMYARRKSWPLEQVEISVQHDRIHADDCVGCETESGKIDRLRRSIHLQGELDETQRQRLLEIADRCPVHRTLVSEIHIESTLA